MLATGRDRRRAADAIEGFRAGHADVLVATDLAAEGLNLQRAGTVVHYDLPWNPVKVDQRNGRALRIGQTRESVTAIYFLPNGDRSRVLSIVARKNETRRRLLEARRRGGRRSTEGDDARSCRVGCRGCPARETWFRTSLFRRHKAGVERLLAALSTEYLDERKLRDLAEVLALEPGGLRHV